MPKPLLKLAPVKGRTRGSSHDSQSNYKLMSENFIDAAHFPDANIHRGIGPDAHTASLFPGEPLKAVLRGPYDPKKYPAQITTYHGDGVIWYLDKAAARLIG
jgi:6-phosphogluconolactonase/glucosamine-6-phosphate isomerase/deaminase